MIRLLLHHSTDKYHSVISPYSNIACCIFATESAYKRGSAEYSTCSRGRIIKYLRFRNVHHQMWKAKVFSRLERTHIPGRKNSKSRGVAMTSDSGRWFSSRIRGKIETRDPRAVILAFYPRSHVQPSAEGIAKKRRPKPPL